jgi:hypothetical protein
MITLPIAHAGHWFEGALYLAPVVILVVVLFVQGRRDKDEDDFDVDDAPPPAERGESKARDARA